MSEKILTLNIHISYIIILSLIGFYFIYHFYSRRINNFLLLYIDNIIIITILFLVYKVIFNNGDNSQLFWYIVSIIGFFVILLQYRKNKEYELINEFIKNKNKDTPPIKELIDGFILLGPILKHDNNLLKILRREVSNVIFDSENSDELKKGLEKILLQISDGNDYKILLYILKLNKGGLKNTITRLIKDKDIEKLNEKVKIYDELINLTEKTESGFIRKKSLKQRIKYFFTPNP